MAARGRRPHGRVRRRCSAGGGLRLVRPDARVTGIAAALFYHPNGPIFTVEVEERERYEVGGNPYGLACVDADGARGRVVVRTRRDYRADRWRRLSGGT